MSGIRTIKDLLDRCRVDAETGCWIWTGAVANTTPSMRIPALGRTVGAGVAICFLTTGKLPDDGVIWHRTCRTKFCVCPSHRTPGSRGSQMDFQRGQPKPLLVRARIAAARRAHSDVPESAIEEIRSSTETGLALAARLGISHTHVCRIRRHEARCSFGMSAFSVWGGGNG